MVEDGLTWENISEFTWEDLEKLNITWEDARLSKEKLLEKIQNQDAPVPIPLYEQFKKICESVPEEVKTKISVFNSIKNIGGTILLIMEILEHTEWLADHVQELTQIVKEIIKYFS